MHINDACLGESCFTSTGLEIYVIFWLALVKLPGQIYTCSTGNDFGWTNMHYIVTLLKKVLELPLSMILKIQQVHLVSFYWRSSSYSLQKSMEYMVWL